MISDRPKAFKGPRQKPETETKSYLTSHNKTQKPALSQVHTLAAIAHGIIQHSARETFSLVILLTK